MAVAPFPVSQIVQDVISTFSSGEEEDEDNEGSVSAANEDSLKISSERAGYPSKYGPYPSGYAPNGAPYPSQATKYPSSVSSHSSARTTRPTRPVSYTFSSSSPYSTVLVEDGANGRGLAYRVIVDVNPNSSCCSTTIIKRSLYEDGPVVASIDLCIDPQPKVTGVVINGKSKPLDEVLSPEIPIGSYSSRMYCLPDLDVIEWKLTPGLWMAYYKDQILATFNPSPRNLILEPAGHNFSDSVVTGLVILMREQPKPTKPQQPHSQQPTTSPRPQPMPAPVAPSIPRNAPPHPQHRPHSRGPAPPAPMPPREYAPPRSAPYNLKSEPEESKPHVSNIPPYRDTRSPSNYSMKPSSRPMGNYKPPPPPAPPAIPAAM